MTITPMPCIHGFPAEQCVSCHTCEHGNPAATCTRCRASATARKAVVPAGDQTAHVHAGHEIFYEAAVSGWRYRAPDAPASTLSYRSAFLARKAVDELQRTGASADKPAKRKRRQT